jgi:ribonuclease HI
MSDFSDDAIAEIGMDMLSDEERPRRWHPTQGPATSPIWLQSPSELIKYNPEKQVSQLQMKPVSRDPVADKSTMVVGIDGRYQQNENLAPSYGIYFGPDSKYNTKGILEKSLPQTQSRVEIEALSKALDIIYSICDKDFSLSQIYIGTASESLYRAITDHIYGWVEDGGAQANGKEVENFVELKRLHELLEEKWYGDDGGIEVRFWETSSEENRQARALALAALD